VHLNEHWGGGGPNCSVFNAHSCSEPQRGANGFSVFMVYATLRMFAQGSSFELRNKISI